MQKLKSFLFTCGSKTFAFAIAAPYAAVLILAGLLALGIFGTGCASASGEGGSGTAATITPQRVQAITALGTYVFATQDLSKHPEHRQDYERARFGLAELITHERWDAKAMAQALSASGTSFEGSEGTLYVGAAPLLFDAISGGRFDLSTQEMAKAAILGAHEGISLALGPASRDRGRSDSTLDRLRARAEASRP